MRVHPAVCSILMCGLLLLGCGEGNRQASDSSSDDQAAGDDKQQRSSTDQPADDAPRRPQIRLGGADASQTPKSSTKSAGAPTFESSLAALKPLQVMLGRWEGKTRQQTGDFGAVDYPSWVWDFKTDPTQPALVMTSQEGNPYLKSARLTYDGAHQLYRLKSVDGAGEERSYEGSFSEKPRLEDVDGDTIPDQLYKLELTEVTDQPAKEAWRLVFNQQQNNRYLMEVYRKRGQRDFRRHDTVANQRSDTSFAQKDDDYGKRTCIITQGLGTIAVSFKGTTYYVCCSGCKATFEDDPQKWIARFQKQQAMKDAPK